MNLHRNPDGSAPAMESVPVVIASDQAAIPVSVTSSPAPAGGATSAKQDTGNASLSSIDTKTGSLTETAPASDTASSGLNGRLQRIAQRLTSVFTALSDGTQQSKITNGTNVADVKAVSGKNSIYISPSSAAGAALPTEAMLIGGSDGTNMLALRTFNPVSDGLSGSGSGSLAVVATNFVNNGTNYDRLKNNTTGALIAAGATTAQTVNLVTYNASHLMLLVNIASGAGTVTVAINGTSVSGYVTNLLTSTALTGVGVTTLRVSPSAIVAANLAANSSVPRNISVTVTVTGTVAYGIDWILSV